MLQKIICKLMISLAVFNLPRTLVPTLLLPRQLFRCIEFHKILQIIVISLFKTFLLTWKLRCWKKWHLQTKTLTKSFLVCLYHNEFVTHSMKNRRKIIKVHKVLCFLWGFFFRLFFFVCLVCTCWQYSFCSSDTTDGFVISHLKIFHYI